MKRRYLLTAIALLIGLFAGYAFAGVTTIPRQPGEMQHNGGDMIQNIQGLAPKKGATVCAHKVLTKGGQIATFNLYTGSRWFQAAHWKVVNGSGTEVPVKVYTNYTSTRTGDYMPGSSGTILVSREYKNYRLDTFSNESTSVANGTYNACQDRE